MAKPRRATALAATLALALPALGCATGPVRRVTLGDWQYAAREWTRAARPARKPIVAVGGAFADAGLLAVDTLAAPIGAVLVAGVFAFYGPCPKFDGIPPGLVLLPIVPIYFAAGLVFSPVSAWMMTYGWSGTDRWRDTDTAMQDSAALSSAAAPREREVAPTATPGPLPTDKLRP